MGGSAAHGISSAPPYPVVHVYPEETVDAHLERLLKEAMPDQNVEVINAAVTGYHVFQHTAYLQSELLNYDPDLIIFMDGANDHYVNNDTYDYYQDFVYQYWKPRLQNPSLSGLVDYVANYMAEYSGLFRGYVAWSLQRDAIRNSEKSSLTSTFISEEETLQKYDAVAEEQYLRSIQANIDLLKRAGVEVLISLQPQLVLRDKEFLSQVESDFYRATPTINVLYQEVLKDLTALSEGEDITFIDLNPAFNSADLAGEQLFIDYCHLNRFGGEIVARALLPVVMEKMVDASEF
jgi:lysophospholipase L1-like esterase